MWMLWLWDVGCGMRMDVDECVRCVPLCVR
jgi:hypothetical protein